MSRLETTGYFCRIIYTVLVFVPLVKRNPVLFIVIILANTVNFVLILDVLILIYFFFRDWL